MRIKLLVGALTLGCAIAISAVAAYFSVVGLAALFAAAFIPVCIMGTFLEASKLIAAGWLHSNWKNSHVSRLHKGYLVAAILTLMTVTSMGIYGYLMKAHLEQNAPTAAIQVDLDQKQARLDQLTAQRDQLLVQEKAIDQTVTGYLGSGKAAGAGRFLNQQKGAQAELETKISAVNDQITQANVDMAPLKKKVAASGVELGQWKYLAKALGLKDPDAAIDILVKMLMFAFDPMAVVLMISGTITLGEWTREKREHIPEKSVLETLAPEVDDDEIELAKPKESDHLDDIADLSWFARKGCVSRPIPPEYIGHLRIDPEAKPEHDPEYDPFWDDDKYPEWLGFEPDTDPDGFNKFVGIQQLEAPTGQIFKLTPPIVTSVSPPFSEIVASVTDDQPGGETNDVAAIEDYVSGGPPAEGRWTKVETLPEGENLGEIGDLEFFREKLARGLQTNYLDWSNAVVEAHAVDTEVEPTEERAPEPDLAPQDHGEVALVIQTDEDDIEWLEPAEPISLEEAFEREMANEDVRLEEDINRVGDRDILLALLESNPTLLEELVRVVEEVKAETSPDAEEVVDENDPRPLHWFEAKNPPTPGGKN